MRRYLRLLATHAAIVGSALADHDQVAPIDGLCYIRLSNEAAAPGMGPSSVYLAEAASGGDADVEAALGTLSDWQQVHCTALQAPLYLWLNASGPAVAALQPGYFSLDADHYTAFATYAGGAYNVYVSGPDAVPLPNVSPERESPVDCCSLRIVSAYAASAVTMGTGNSQCINCAPATTQAFTAAGGVWDYQVVDCG
jgi:hypothetical protein